MNKFQFGSKESVFAAMKYLSDRKPKEYRLWQLSTTTIWVLYEVCNCPSINGSRVLLKLIDEVDLCQK